MKKCRRNSNTGIEAAMCFTDAVHKQAVNKQTVNKLTLNKQAINKQAINKQAINNKVYLKNTVLSYRFFLEKRLPNV